MLSAKEKLPFIETFDTMSNTQKDYAASLVANERGKRIREVTDDEVLDYHKDLVKQVFDEYCNDDIERGFVFTANGYTYRTNRDDQINFIGQYLLLREDYTITEVFWKTENAGQQPVSRDNFMLLYREALMHKNDTIRKYWIKKQDIDACDSHTKVRAIKWNDPAPIVEQPVEEPVTDTTTPTDTTGGTDTTTTTEPPATDPPAEPIVESVPEEPVNVMAYKSVSVMDDPLVDRPVMTSIPSKQNIHAKNWRPAFFAK